MKLTDKHVFFWGGPFSNFEPAIINWDGKVFPTSEHLFMYQKAIFFNDTQIAEEILKVEHPKEAKKLGRKVSNFSEDEWKTAREDAMYIAVKEKFSQNPELKELLCDPMFDEKEFVEASPYDLIWGIGRYEDEEGMDLDDKKNWRGLNLLGKIITKVRKELM